MQADVRALINNSPISMYQLMAIGLCYIVIMLDGFDVLVMAFTGPTISEEWRLSG